MRPAGPRPSGSNCDGARARRKGCDVFAKIFSSIYDGTLADNWQALVTFQQILILADPHSGVLDMTPAAIARRTGIPLEIIEAGIAALEGPDPSSRSGAMEGRRIARLSDDRTWGWWIVNHDEYRRRITAAEKREADRDRIAAKRAEARTDNDDVSHGVAECRKASRVVANVAQVEVEEEEALSQVGEGSEKPPARAREAPPQSPPPDDPTPKQGQPTRSGLIALALIAGGVVKTRINPHTPAFRQVVDSDIQPEEVEATASELVAKGKRDQQYILAAIIGRRREAADAAPIPSARRTPTPAAHMPWKPERRARTSSESQGAPAAFAEIAKQLGIHERTDA